MNGIKLNWVTVYSTLGVLVCTGFLMAHLYGWHGFNWLFSSQRHAPGGRYGHTYHK